MSSICWPAIWTFTRASRRSTISRISSRVSWRNTTVASMRLRNSGRNVFFSSASTLSFMRSYSAAAWTASVPPDAEADRRVALQLLGADVAGHDDDRVAEVDPAALRIGQVAVLQDLEEDVEDLRVRLLDLVEQDHAVALAAHRLGQLAALVEADVAGRRADEPRHVVALHELAHVDLDERVLAAEHELGERPRQLGLADPGGPHEDERADRPLRVLEPGPRAPDGAADRVDRLLLADDAAVEGVLHVEQPLLLLLADADDRDARSTC